MILIEIKRNRKRAFGNGQTLAICAANPWNPDPMLYVDSFNQAGFSTTIDRRDYTTKGTKKFWYDLIRNRMFSTLRDFTDAEIEDGIKELEDKYPDTDELPLISHEVFILATKP